jgi:hypothetical protein
MDFYLHKGIKQSKTARSSLCKNRKKILRKEKKKKRGKKDAKSRKSG